MMKGKGVGTMGQKTECLGRTSLSKGRKPFPTKNRMEYNPAVCTIHQPPNFKKLDSQTTSPFAHPLFTDLTAGNYSQRKSNDNDP